MFSVAFAWASSLRLADCAAAATLLLALAGASLASPTTPSVSATATSTPVSRGPIAPPRRDVPGQRFEIPLGQVYVPDFFDPTVTTSTDVLVFFHGAAWCAQQAFYDSRRNAVLVTVSLSMDEYPRRFRDPSVLDELLTATLTKLDDHDITSRPLGRLALASFSGGYSAIREILRAERHDSLISDVVLADSLYARRKPEHSNNLDPDDMAPFLRAARRAAADELRFQFTQLYPPKPEHRGNTTTLAADYLIDRLRLRRVPAHDRTSRGALLAYRAEAGDLHILGCTGMTTQDHFEHFYAIGDLFARTRLPEAKFAPTH